MVVQMSGLWEGVRVVNLRQWRRCPKCGATMKLREGKQGLFWGCSSYPVCNGTRRLER